MTARSHGKLYDEKRTTKEIAEIVRRQIRLEARMGLLPEGKWSVTMDRYAGGSSITISFLPEDDELFARAYFNRDRIVHEAERPHEYSAIPYRSRFGTVLVARLEQMLADHNHDGSDPMRDIYDVKFAAHVNIRPETSQAALVDLHRGRCLPETPLAELNPIWAQMLVAWEKEATERKAEAEARRAVKDAMDRAKLEAATPATAPATPHLRLVPSPSPVQTAYEKAVEGLTDGEKKIVDKLIALARPLPKRKPIAALVEDPVPQAPNDAWLRLAMASDLKLDFEIPGLGERRR